MRDLLPL